MNQQLDSPTFTKWRPSYLYYTDDNTLLYEASNHYETLTNDVKYVPILYRTAIESDIPELGPQRELVAFIRLSMREAVKSI